SQFWALRGLPKAGQGGPGHCTRIAWLLSAALHRARDHQCCARPPSIHAVLWCAPRLSVSGSVRFQQTEIGQPKCDTFLFRGAAKRTSSTMVSRGCLRDDKNGDRRAPCPAWTEIIGINRVGVEPRSPSRHKRRLPANVHRWLGALCFGGKSDG